MMMFSKPRRLAFPNASMALLLSLPGPRIVLAGALDDAESGIVDGSVEAKENVIDSERGKCMSMEGTAHATAFYHSFC